MTTRGVAEQASAGASGPVTPLGSLTTVTALLDERARRTPGRVGIALDTGAQLTYSEWQSRSRTLSAALIAAGVRPGDRVALVFTGEQLVEYGVAYVGVQRAGGVAVPIPADEPMARLRELAEVTGASAVIGGAQAPALNGNGWQASLSDLERAGSTQSEVATQATPDGLAEFLFTSGTAGAPKPVSFTHADLVAGRLGRRAHEAGAAVPPDVHLHSFGFGTNAFQMALRWPLEGPNRTVVHQTPFVPERFLQTAIDRHATTVSLLPIHAHWLVRESRRAGVTLPEVGRVTVTGATSSTTLLEALHGLFTAAVIVNAYAVTEVGRGIASTELDKDRPQSVGRPSPVIDVQVRAQDGRACATHQPGSIWVRRHRTATGTGHSTDPVPETDTGWVCTGDVGRLDDDGHLHLIDRKEDVIVSGGVTLSSTEVESALMESPHVADVAVTGRPHPTLDEMVVAWVVLGDPETPVSTLHEEARRLLAPHKRPHIFEVIGELPRNRAGKVEKARLRRMPASESPRDPALAPLVERLANVCAELLGVEGLDPRLSFIEAGGDSLAAMRLVARVGDVLGASLPLVAVFEATSIDELAQCLSMP